VSIFEGEFPKFLDLLINSFRRYSFSFRSSSNSF